MRKLVLQMQISVDGFVSSDQDVEWSVWDWSDNWTWDPALKQDWNAIFAEVGTILLSRKMAQQGYINHWKGMAERHIDDPQWAFAQRICDVEKVVFTNQPGNLAWDTATVAKGQLPAVVEDLKQQGGANIICFGGATFGKALLDANLVDELQLFVNPTAVGRGVSLFDRPIPLTLLGATSHACGIVVSRYAPQVTSSA